MITTTELVKERRYSIIVPIEGGFKTVDVVYIGYNPKTSHAFPHEFVGMDPKVDGAKRGSLFSYRTDDDGFSLKDDGRIVLSKDCFQKQNRQMGEDEKGRLYEIIMRTIL